MNKKARIFLTGHNGMVGSALMRALKINEYVNILTASRQYLDLRNSEDVAAFFNQEKPEFVIMAAAKVGGIKANSKYPADFLYDNLMIQNNIIHNAYLVKVKKLCFLGSSCIYPRECKQPMKESYIMTGPLEPTNEAYALAKISGFKMAQYYFKQYGMNCINPMPCNLYGTNDSFDPENSHVLSALIRKFVDALAEKEPEVTVWGTGEARREFMHVDDLAKAVLFLMENSDSPELVNIGWGKDISIKELAELVAKISGYKGNIRWDKSMPDGMPRKCLDTTILNSMGFQPTISLEKGIEMTIKEYLNIRKKRITKGNT